jgi:hypothetical protein
MAVDEPHGNRRCHQLVVLLSSQTMARPPPHDEEQAVQTLLEIIQALAATPRRRLSDLHLVADGRHATAYLCFAPPLNHGPTMVGEVLPVGLHEQLEALAASQLVGQLHITVLQHGGDREVHLLAKTHAGSATERTAWRHSLA